MIHSKSHILLFMVLSLLALPVCAQTALAQDSLTTIDAPQGGRIVYGVVEGARTEAAAMGKILRAVHNNCGEKPQVGKVFKVRGTDSNAVFFTVVNHPAGDKRVAGLVIASQSGPHCVEAALVSDEASRFGSTVNPMLQQLFSVWRPDGAGGASTPADEERKASGGGASAARLHKVTLPDDTASVGIPRGWTVDPGCAKGTITVTGPHKERVFLNLWFGALDPYGPGFRRMRQMGVKPLQHTVIYPSNVDMVKAFPEIFQRLRASNGLGPVELQLSHVEQVPASQGTRCVHASGRAKAEGKDTQEMDQMICATAPNPDGQYSFYVFASFLPYGVADQERATAAAIIGSFQVDVERVNQVMAPILSSMRQNYEAQQQQLLARSRQAVNQINQIGANATARYNATQAANERQHQAWNNQQNSSSRNAQGFSNYLLDQTVVQDNDHNTHKTEWNRTADALVKVHPHRFEIVDTPNYWKGVDY